MVVGITDGRNIEDTGVWATQKVNNEIGPRSSTRNANEREHIDIKIYYNKIQLVTKGRNDGNTSRARLGVNKKLLRTKRFQKER